MNYRTFLLILCLAASAAAQTASRVGMVTRDFTDEQRRNWQGSAPRPLRTAVWYPAADTTTESETIFGGPPDAEVFAPVTVAPGAEISRAKLKYPLVVLSHGTGGSALQMMWLGYYLASRGYIVAAINHHGNTGAEQQPVAQGFLLYWERARDVSVLLDKLLADPLFGRRIDPNRIGAAGFSLGGFTVISIGGGQFSPDVFTAFCQSPQRDFTCEPQPEFPDARKLLAELRKTNPPTAESLVVEESFRRAGNSYRDPRIKRVFAIAPALGSGFTKRGLATVRVPVSIVVGQADKVAPPRTNAQRFAQFIKGAKLTILEGAVGHYAFLAECNAHGRRILDICRDDPSVDRAQIHERVARMAFEFFEAGWRAK